MITYDFRKAIPVIDEKIKDEEYNTLLSSIFPFAENKKIYIINEISAEFHNGAIEIYNESRKCTVISGDINNIILTEAMAKNNIGKEDIAIEQSKKVGIFALLNMSAIMEIEQNKSTKIKIKKLKHCSKVEIPSQGLKYTKYDNEGPFEVTDKGNGVFKVYVPSHNTTLDFPTLTYPFPRENPKYFYFGNTEELTDQTVSNLLKDLYIRMGMCFDNTNAIYRVLNNEGYTKEHKVDIYSGWLIPYQTAHNHIAFHCWMVIDDKYLIDTTSMSRTLKKMLESERKGQYVDIQTREDYAMAERKEMDADIPFSQKYTYGKVPEDFLYIGSKMESTDSAKEFMAYLWDKFPYHPSFSGMNRETGNNKLHDIARKLENR